jgi:TetR/AcrR family transcriptional repressor of nem operon
LNEEVAKMAQVSVREEIVEAAVDLFHARGFNGAGVKDITDAAGVPKGSFYNHFPSKEALAVEALRRYGAARRLEDLRDTTIEPLTRLRQHFEFLRDEDVERYFTRGCMIGNFGTEISDHSEAIRTAVRESLSVWAGLISVTLAEAQEAGSLRSLDPDATSHFLLNAWEGTLIQARAEQSSTAFETWFALVFDTLLA